MYTWLRLKKSIIHWLFSSCNLFFNGLSHRCQIGTKWFYEVFGKKMKKHYLTFYLVIMSEIVYLMRFLSKIKCQVTKWNDHPKTLVMHDNQNCGGITMSPLVMSRQSEAVMQRLCQVLDRESDSKSSHQWQVTIGEFWSNGQMDGGRQMVGKTDSKCTDGLTDWAR